MVQKAVDQIERSETELSELWAVRALNSQLFHPVLTLRPRKFLYMVESLLGFHHENLRTLLETQFEKHLHSDWRLH